MVIHVPPPQYYVDYMSKKNQRVIHYFFKTLSFWGPFLESCLITYHSNKGVQLRQITKLDMYTLVSRNLLILLSQHGVICGNFVTFFHFDLNGSRW